MPLNRVPSGKSAAADDLLSVSVSAPVAVFALTAVASWVVAFVVRTAPAAADPEYPSSDRLERPDIVPPVSGCHERLLPEVEPDRTKGAIALGQNRIFRSGR
ncbi:hypothetical protein SCAB_78331 [Streptomyces scabiei 87.22]|uniref:Uncharacterized protein n=1 Tax=Streptomyces scabiei (strain 87.22) TaxID=680198 RepID=C9ZCK9_STRSW|nr:hypothetical protein SCAB_78331 [Streptomyces scabiei 87.22]